MSKRELRNGRIDDRAWYGVAVVATALGSLALILHRHKRLSDVEKLAELDKADSARIIGYANRIGELREQIAHSKKLELNNLRRTLIQQYEARIARLQAESTLPSSTRLLLTKVREAEAEVDDVIAKLEEPTTPE